MVSLVEELVKVLNFIFPKTGDLNNLNSFKEMMECCIALIEKQENLSNEMRLKNLPAISYKVTANYEKIDLAGDNTILKPSTTAYKIFTLTDPNTNILIIADDIQAILIKFKEFSRYQFNNLGNVSLVDEKPNYDVYSVSRI